MKLNYLIQWMMKLIIIYRDRDSLYLLRPLEIIRVSILYINNRGNLKVEKWIAIHSKALTNGVKNVKENVRRLKM